MSRIGSSQQTKGVRVPGQGWSPGCNKTGGSCINEGVGTLSEPDRGAEFTRFAASQAGGLARLAYTLTGDYEAARDLTQDALVAVFRSWERVASADSPVAYARRVLINRRLADLRRPRVAELLTAEPDSRCAALSQDGRYDEREALWQALSNITVRQRTVLVLRYYEDLTDSEIAELLGCGQSTVRSLAARGLAALRSSALSPTRLDPSHVEPPEPRSTKT
jgi:RNA polymerase sigma-70 factor (sigma-E family)